MNPGFPKENMLIGQLSDLTGVKIETIRYYERIGIMPKPRRSEGGQRLYDEAQLKHLRFVKRSRLIGFSLEEIRSLLSLNDQEALNCNEVYSLTKEHLKEVQNKILELETIEKSLKDLAKQCSRGSKPDCPIIDMLYGSDEYSS
jgi:MerR family mercuric resistance operon transcriptional regulator